MCSTGVNTPVMAMTKDNRPSEDHSGCVRATLSRSESLVIPIAWKPNEPHWIALIRFWKNAVSLAVSINEVHDFSNFGHGSGLELVFSLDFFQPGLHFERMYA